MNDQRDMVLADLWKCDRMLQTITTMEAGLKIAATAEALLVYAKKVKAGIEVQNRCTEFRAKVERRCGEIREQLGKAKGAPGPGRGKAGSKAGPAFTTAPTSVDLHLTKKTSARMATLASVPEEKITAMVAAATARREELSLPKLMDTIRGERKPARKAAKQEAESAAIVELADEPDPDIVCADFRTYLETCTADAIVTDPPYPKEYLPLYGDLARLSKRFALVAVMCGQSYLPQIVAAMTEHLEYCWTFAYLTPGGQAVQLWDRQVLAFWKPVLVFGRLPEWAGDVVKSPVNANEKDHHGWGQSVGGMQDLIRRLTTAGQTICDPFIGGGTTAVAAVTTGRRIIGCDIDAECIATTKRRIAACRT